jgi:hypothetical protein
MSILKAEYWVLGQNVTRQIVVDKLSWTKCREVKMSLDKMSRTKCLGKNVADKMSRTKFAVKIFRVNPILTSRVASMKVKGRGLVCKECWFMAGKLG